MPEEYERFGPEWAKEMEKFPKKIIIAMFRESQLSLNETREMLLKTTQNLGHPAYGLSSGTTIAIDELREKAFDFLGIPKAPTE